VTGARLPVAGSEIWTFGHLDTWSLPNSLVLAHPVRPGPGSSASVIAMHAKC